LLPRARHLNRRRIKIKKTLKISSFQELVLIKTLKMIVIVKLRRKRRKRKRIRKRRKTRKK